MKLFCYFDKELKQWGLPFPALNAHTASRDLMRQVRKEEHEEGYSITLNFVELYLCGEWDQENSIFKDLPNKKINWERAAESLTKAIDEEEKNG